MRGILEKYHGVDPKAVRGVQGGVNAPGGPGERMPLRLSDGYRIADLEDRSLNGALAAGEIGSMITTRLLDGLAHGTLRCVFPEVKAAERAIAWRSTSL